MTEMADLKFSVCPRSTSAVTSESFLLLCVVPFTIVVYLASGKDATQCCHIPNVIGLVRYTAASLTSDRCRCKISVLNLELDEPCWLHEQHVLRTSSYDPTRSPGLSLPLSVQVCISRQSDPPLCMDNFCFFFCQNASPYTCLLPFP